MLVKTAWTVLPSRRSPDTSAIQRASRSGEPGWPAGIESARRRKYGETTLWYGHAA